MTVFDSKASIERFKQFCKVNNLRAVTAQDKLPIAPILGYKTNKYVDHMYEGWTEFYGVWISRPSPRALSTVMRQLKKLGCISHQTGDMEATMKVPFDKALEVARFLNLVKGRSRGLLEGKKTRCGGGSQGKTPHQNLK